MDFESLYPAIPRYAGMRPYSHIPFQWSVHRQLEPDAAPEHFEFLADDDRDPRREFAISLCDALGKRGPIIVYNATFESQRFRDLAEWLSGPCPQARYGKDCSDTARELIRSAR